MKSSLLRVVLGLTLALGVSVQAAEVRVMAGAAIAPALDDIARQFERKTGHKLIIDYGILQDLKKKIDAGEVFDLAIVGEGSMNDAKRQGRIVADTRIRVARVGMAVAVKAGAPKPDIGSVEAFKRTLLGAKSIAYPPKGAIGIHLAKVFATLGISDQMSSKIKALKTVELVPHAVSSGEAELGFAPSTVLIAGSGIDIVGPLPGELQRYIVYESAVGTEATEPDAARAFIQYLAMPDAVSVMRAKGFDVEIR
jgi:molybdate transport system substrate-binding protein